jgi:dihydroorotase
MANLTLFDPDTEYIFENSNILSKSKNSAFIGKNLKGKIYGVVSNNKLVLN